MVTQLFFISPKGYQAVKDSRVQWMRGVIQCHGWTPGTKEDAENGEVIGVVEMNGADIDEVLDALEAQGIMYLPNHTKNQTIAAEHAAVLAKHGVEPHHTTAEAMTIVHAKAGMPVLKPKGYSRRF
jgi:hypothetical protein